jgi:hypothetical protein
LIKLIRPVVAFGEAIGVRGGMPMARRGGRVPPLD